MEFFATFFGYFTFFQYLLSFLFVLTILVVVHELGHYLIARAYGVRVEIFSFGFGPELFGYSDRLGTRWKFSLVPLGGYVKMFGDTNVSSTEGTVLSPQEQPYSFHYQSLSRRTLIILGGPFGNFLFAILALAGLFFLYGQPFTSTEIVSIQSGSPAEEAGLKPGDVITEIDGRSVHRFEELQTFVQVRANQPLSLVFKRADQLHTLSITPRAETITDALGNTRTVGLIGIIGAAIEYRRHSFPAAFWHAILDTKRVISLIMTTLGQMLSGTRGVEDLGGPLRIAQMSGMAAQSGVVTLIWFMALLSINLGLINLFPIPLLDGGHLVFYAFEAVRGKPLGKRAQEYGIRIGFAFVITLMLFALWNDLVQIRAIEFLTNLFS